MIKAMASLLVIGLFLLLQMVVGGFDIRMAICRFKQERYFLCGCWIMAAVYSAAYLFKFVMDI